MVAGATLCKLFLSPPMFDSRYGVCLSEFKLARTDDEVRREMA